MSMTKTGRLIKTFKETVKSRIETGEIEWIDDETLEKLQECLRTAIQTSSRINQEPLSVQLPNSSPSLQPLPVSNFGTMEDTRTTNLRSPYRTSSSFTSPTIPRQSLGNSTSLQRSGHNELIGESFSDYIARGNYTPIILFYPDIF